MQVEITHRPSYALAYVRMAVGESVYAEPGSMVALSAGIDVAASAAGGIGKAFMRHTFGQESFLMTRFSASLHGAWIAVAPKYPGDVAEVDVAQTGPLNLESGALLAYASTVETSTKFGNIQSIALREGATVVQAHGHGSLLLASYGGIERFELGPQENIVVDTGHLVAWSASLGFRVGPLKGMVSSQLTGEGLVGELTGPGTVYVQTRAESQLRSWIFPNRGQNTGRS